MPGNQPLPATSTPSGVSFLSRAAAPEPKQLDSYHYTFNNKARGGLLRDSRVTFRSMIFMRADNRPFVGAVVRATVTHREHVGLLSSRFEVLLTIEMSEVNLLVIRQTRNALEEATLLEAPRGLRDAGELQYYSLGSLQYPAMQMTYTFGTPAEARRFEARALAALTDIQKRIGDNDPAPSHTTHWDFP